MIIRTVDQFHCYCLSTVFSKIFINRLNKERHSQQLLVKQYLETTTAVCHQLALNELLEYCSEYIKSLCMTFFGFEKYFDSASMKAVMKGTGNKKGVLSDCIQNI